MKPVLMMILVLGFTSVTMENEKTTVDSDGGEFPAANGKVPKMGNVVSSTEPLLEMKKVHPDNVPEANENDVDTFWEVTRIPKVSMRQEGDAVDGNRPDNDEITTHDHVDRTIGHVTPTKRVKKILPPFYGIDKGTGRNVRNVEASANRKTGNESKSNAVNSRNIAFVNNASVTTTEATRNAKNSGILPVSEKRQTGTTEGVEESRLKPSPKPREYSANGSKTDAEITSAQSETSYEGISSVAPKETLSSVQTTSSPDATTKGKIEHKDGVIEGIRLVPNEIGLLMPGIGENELNGAEEEDDDEGKGNDVNVRKTIWDLLKEREESDVDASDLDGKKEVEATRNWTVATEEPTTQTLTERQKSKALYEHFDADSDEVEFETQNFKGNSNIEKHELPLSFAYSWLQVKDKKFDGENAGKERRKNGSGNVEKNKTEIPQDVSKLLEMSQNKKAANGVTVSIINGGGDYARYGRRPGKWYLLLLAGNSTIVKLRRKDFTKYLKLNLAARLSVEYDDVKVNKVILAPPKVLVNVSVFAPSDDVAEESQLDFKEKFNDKGEAPLYKLAETNATLLELSGEEFHVIRFLSLESQKPEAEAQKDASPETVSMASRHDDVEFIIYTFLGSACACAVILAIFITLNRYFRKMSDFDWLRFKSKSSSWKIREDVESDKDEFNGISPAVIYSGGFPQIRGSWMNGAGSRRNRHAAAPSILQQYPGIELGASPPHRRNPPGYPELEERPCSSPRHSKLQIYNCDAKSLVIPIPPQNKARPSKNEGSDTHPLDVRIGEEKTGQDNPIFTN